MRTSIFTLFALVILSQPLKADILLSISNTNPFAGADIELTVGQKAWMSIWASTEPGQAYTGFAIDVWSDNPGVSLRVKSGHEVAG